MPLHKIEITKKKKNEFSVAYCDKFFADEIAIHSWFTYQITVVTPSLSEMK